jgi:hypothetical protein
VSMDPDCPTKPDPREHLEVRPGFLIYPRSTIPHTLFEIVLGMLPLRGDTTPVTM